MSQKYLVLDGTDPVYEDEDLDKLETTIRGRASSGSLSIHFLLDLQLQATVVRDEEVADPAKRETVVLVSGDVEKRFSRYTELGVSCERQGKTVPVDTININFRPYEDSVTDRGIVWVFPGVPAGAYFNLNLGAFNAASESVRSIVEAAEAAVHDEVLRHFIAEQTPA